MLVSHCGTAANTTSHFITAALDDDSAACLRADQRL